MQSVRFFRLLGQAPFRHTLIKDLNSLPFDNDCFYVIHSIRFLIHVFSEVRMTMVHSSL